MVKTARRTTRNPQLVKGIGALSRTALSRKKMTYKFTKVTHPAKPVAEKKAVEKPMNNKSKKNGSSRTISSAPRFYAADDVKMPVASRKVATKAKLRSSIAPGQVLILLAGRFRGKRVVFLKQLESGLLLVTGPHKINGVPLRRVNQAYVIATSVNVGAVNVPENINDSYFARSKSSKSSKSEDEFFAKDEKKAELPAERKADQKKVDEQVLAAVAKVENLKQYLGARFTLSNSDKPHELKF